MQFQSLFNTDGEGDHDSYFRSRSYLTKIAAMDTHPEHIRKCFQNRGNNSIIRSRFKTQHLLYKFTRSYQNRSHKLKENVSSTLVIIHYSDL